MTISSEITNILNDLGSRLGVAIDWTSQNVTPYIQDLISRIAKLEMCNSIIILIFGIICLIATILCIGFFIKHYEDDVDEFTGIAITVGCFVCAILMFILIPIGIDGLTKSIYLPEFTAVEYIQKLIK